MLRILESRIAKPKRRLAASRRVQRKYRRAFQRQLQRQEYARLASVIPGLAAPDDEVEVVEGAIQYIEELHKQILHRMVNGEYLFLYSTNSSVER